MDRPLELLSALVSIPSHVSQPQGIEAVGQRIGAELAGFGFERSEPAPAIRRAPAWAEQILSPSVGFDDLLDPVVWQRPGMAPGDLLILGDLDAALALEEEDCRLAVRDGLAIGPAVADMKGGLVVLVEALRNLTRSRLPTPAMTVVLSPDEQAGSLRSAATISQRAAAATWCLCLECARDGGRLMRSRGHIGIGRLTATGAEAHAGSAREAGINAISLLARGIAALDELSGREATVTPTILTGGRRRSLVPGEATVVLDVRASDSAAWSVLEDGMRASLVEGLDLRLFNHRPGLPVTERTEWFLDLVREVGNLLGLEIESMDSLAAGSSAFVDSTRIPVLDGMGPAGGALMTESEYIEIDSLSTRGALLATTIQRLAS